MIEQILTVLREKQFDKKPNVDELKAIEGLAEVNGKQRDEAWAIYQEELKAAAGEQATTTTTATTDTKPEEAEVKPEATHMVTVKKEGFRRLGRAWTGSEKVTLSDKDAAVLAADPMFNVVEL